jgi:hypothetical protein
LGKGNGKGKRKRKGSLTYIRYERAVGLCDLCAPRIGLCGKQRLQKKTEREREREREAEAVLKRFRTLLPL